jgi:DNA-binding XRE family transcriptional regulator
MNEEVQNIVHFKEQYLKIVQELVQIRKSIPMTQAELADWLKVDRRKIIDLENGNINISLLLTYADKLSVDVKFNYTIK